MCDRATLAGRTVKSSAMNFCAFYDEQYRTEMLKTTEIEQDMNEALSGKQFLMYLQPKYCLETGEICGAEVLARWKHPVKGLIQPNDFIPLFERNGFILRLDEYMWEEACKTLAKWRAEGKKPVTLSVNISRYHIKNNDLVSVWRKLIRKYNIPTSDLTLEITETFFHDSSDLYEVLQKLQDMGFKLEVDDFGAGYSSLNMIRQIPVDTIKIDKDFLDKKLSTDKGKIVISHTIAMAKDLKLSVVAEGVETKEHVDFLKSSACDIAQGFYFAKPMPLEDFNRLCYGEEA
jgi:EAL domain-containing protein (putative c-di-GMP-specific phosphodiesterase class I)